MANANDGTVGVISEIKKHLKDDKLVLGKEVTLKMLRNGEIAKVFLASNTDKETEADVVRYTDLNSIEVVKTNLDNEELGGLCKKPFKVMVLSIKK